MSNARIFTSYRRDDTLGITGRIHDKLSAHFGADSVFMDFDNIPVGVDFREHLDIALEACDVLLVVIGPKWLGQSGDRSSNRLLEPSDFVRLEIQAALQRRIMVVPLLVGGTSMPSPQDLPAELESLAYRQAAIVDPGQDFHVHMGRLIAALASVERSKSSPVSEDVDAPRMSAGHHEHAASTETPGRFAGHPRGTSHATVRSRAPAHGTPN